MAVDSPAFDAVCAAKHPTPKEGGPCGTCAFRPGTEANTMPHTVELAKLCVEGVVEFMCHEQPRLCRGWIAAVNARHASGDLEDQGDKYLEVMRMAADVYGRCIDAAVRADKEHAAKCREGLDA